MIVQKKTTLGSYFKIFCEIYDLAKIEQNRQKKSASLIKFIFKNSLSMMKSWVKLYLLKMIYKSE